MKRKTLKETVRLSLDKLSSTDSRLLLAVSGGSDSMAMLHLIHLCRKASSIKVAFVDHGLREGIDREWQLVADQCAELGVTAERLFVTERHENSNAGEGLQQWARDRRYHLLVESAKSFNCNIIVTGHTADDQAETVLLRLLRGTGLDGLGAVPPWREIDGKTAVIRPLLGICREELRQWLREKQVLWVEDPSNENERFARVQARNLLPEMARSNPRIREHLCALSQEAREITQWLNDTVASDDEIVSLRLNDGYRVDADLFLRSPTHLHGRIVRSALQKASGHLLRFERVHIEDVLLGLHTAGRCRKYVLPGGYYLWTAYGALYIFSSQIKTDPRFDEQKLSQRSSNIWMGQHSRMCVSVKVECESAELEKWCTIEAPELRIRSLEAGDRLHGSSKKVARLLGENRIPVMYRGYVPVLATSKGEVISVPGLLKSRVLGLRMEWHLHEACALNDLRQFA